MSCSRIVHCDVTIACDCIDDDLFCLISNDSI